MKDFLKEHFDKLLLTFLFLVMVGVVLYMSHDAANVNWAREQAALILGGLLGLITGVVIGRNTPPPSKPSEPENQP